MDQELKDEKWKAGIKNQEPEEKQEQECKQCR
jgi:hypothetical protein